MVTRSPFTLPEQWSYARPPRVDVCPLFPTKEEPMGEEPQEPTFEENILLALTKLTECVRNLTETVRLQNSAIRTAFGMSNEEPDDTPTDT